MPQAPGIDGSVEEDEDPDLTAVAKTESCRSRSRPWHLGQAGRRSAVTNVSKRVVQSRHW